MANEESYSKSVMAGGVSHRDETPGHQTEGHGLIVRRQVLCITIHTHVHVFVHYRIINDQDAVLSLARV